MSYVVRRATGFAGYYKDPDGRRRSTGILPTRKEAQVAADRAQAGLTPDGKPNQEMTLEQHYQRWIERRDPDVLPNTMRAYEYRFRRYILPAMGERLVTRISRPDVEDLLADLRAEGVSEHGIAEVKAALGSCLRGLVPHVLTYNPTHGIKIRRPPQEDYNLLTREEVTRIIQAMPTEGAQLFTYVLASTGLRHGEAAELRTKDVRFRDGEISVTRRVTDLVRAQNGGKRFRVIAGTKAGVSRGRTVVASPELQAALQKWIQRNELGHDDLLFPDVLVNPDHRVPEGLKQIEPGEEFWVGPRRYQHGTAYGYSGGGCRCEDCWHALRTYRRSRKPFKLQELEHLSTNTWSRIWRAAIEKADLGWRPRSYDLRHHFATMQVAGGVSLPEVARLMGHASIETTMRYQRRVDAQTSKARDVVSAATPDMFRLT